MLRHVTIAVVILASAGAPSVAWADPITYDFTGTLGQPYDGTTSFSGSFTINNATVSGGYVVGDEAGSSMTLHFGNDVVTYTNNPQDPNSEFGISVMPSSAPSSPEGPPWYEIEVIGQTQTPGIGNFGITSYVYNTPLASVTSLQNLPFPSDSTSAYMSLPNGGGTFGSISSIELVPSPEPSTIVVFGLLAVGLVANRIRHRRWAPSEGR